MEKRYQVFVSSTFEDLQDERREVLQALLELDCMPAGMELFPAADEDQWTLIKDVIDGCDYYLIILAGRYGSVGPDGTSYTEMEYRYALEKGKPILAFLHKDPSHLIAGKCEGDPAKKAKLEEFRRFVQRKVCRHWTAASELGGLVSRSMIRLIKHHPASGWIKADQLPTEDPLAEILRLRGEIDNLRRMSYDSVHGARQAGLTKVIGRQANYGTEVDWLQLINSAIERVDLMGRTLFNWTQSDEAADLIWRKAQEDGVAFRWLIMAKENIFLPALQENSVNIEFDLREKLSAVTKFVESIRARLSDTTRERVQIKFFKSVPLYFSYMRVDDRFFITHYLCSSNSGGCPMLCFSGINAELSKAYAREFETVWNLPGTTMAQNDA
jgi:hypothetical protein